MAKSPRKFTRTLGSFDPRFITLWKQALVKPISSTMPKSRAEHLRFTMHSLRSAMRKENHPDAPLVDRAKITISDPMDENPDPQVLVTIGKWDREFEDLLSQFGSDEPPPSSSDPFSEEGLADLLNDPSDVSDDDLLSIYGKDQS